MIDCQKILWPCCLIAVAIIMTASHHSHYRDTHATGETVSAASVVRGDKSHRPLPLGKDIFM